MKEKSTCSDEYVFYTSKNKRVSADSLTKKLKKICKTLDIHSYSIYSLRHTYLTNMAIAKNIELVRDLAGHSKISTTQRYTHFDFFELQKAVNDYKY